MVDLFSIFIFESDGDIGSSLHSSFVSFISSLSLSAELLSPWSIASALISVFMPDVDMSLFTLLPPQLLLLLLLFVSIKFVSSSISDLMSCSCFMSHFPLTLLLSLGDCESSSRSCVDDSKADICECGILIAREIGVDRSWFDGPLDLPMFDVLLFCIVKTFDVGVLAGVFISGVFVCAGEASGDGLI